MHIFRTLPNTGSVTSKLPVKDYQDILVKKPNVFILGAPKCGTTSLANWLTDHPQVYFSPIKEPSFFNYDYGFRRQWSLERYEQLFEGAKESHRAVCEASVKYLYSRTAVPAILAYADSPKFVVMLRDPVRMAPSLHEQTLFNGDEDEEDFYLAWRLQHERLYGASVPKHCRDPQLLQYGTWCKLGEQLERLYQHVPREQTHVIHLEDMQADPSGEYRRLLDFLGLDDDGRETFPVANQAKTRRLPWLIQGVQRGNELLRAMGVPPVRVGFTAFLKQKLRKTRPRPPLSPETIQMLEEHFAEDQLRLERLGHLPCRMVGE